MDRRRFLAALAAACCPLAARGGSDVRWSYRGYNGPANWGVLARGFETCDLGREQSPVDLTGAVDAALPSIAIRWATPAWTAERSHHTIRVHGPAGGHAVIDGRRFELLEFHFHTPAEHAEDGRLAPAEVHFVHRDAEGGLAVIGAFLVPGARNGLLADILRLVPEEEGETPLGVIDPRGLLPPLDRFWRYQGSLTVPPCTETVLWTVARARVEAAAADIDRLAALIGPNARPLQPLHRRFLLAR